MASDPTSAPIELRYNEVRQKSVHNAFQRMEGLSDQFHYWGIRSIEVDLHDKTPRGVREDPDDWAVYHHAADTHSSVERFSDVLDELADFHQEIPDHEVVTVFVDMKSPFPADPDEAHSGRLLDRQIQARLGDSVYRPHQLLESAPGAKWLQTAVTGRGWPLLHDLKGKFIFCLTGSPTALEHYAIGALTHPDRQAFVSVPASSPEDIPGDRDRVFFNANATKNLHLAESASRAGFVARSYYVNSWELWKNAEDAAVHHLATDKVNERSDGWSSTRHESGFPFESIGSAGMQSRQSDEALLGAAHDRTVKLAISEGLDRPADRDGLHLRVAQVAGGHGEITYLVSGARSHTPDDAHGGVVARADSGPQAPFVALLRRGGNEGFCVVYRREDGGRIEVEEASALDEVDGAVQLRLEVIDDVHVKASAIGIGGDPVLLARIRCEAPMQLLGVGSTLGRSDGLGDFQFLRALCVPHPGSDGLAASHMPGVL